MSAQETSWPDLSSPAANVGGGEKDAAVVVGIERYFAVPSVPGALKNANDWYAYLTESLKVPTERVTILRDHDGTVEKMRSYAEKAAKEVQPGGTLWFVFIGHGAPEESAKDGLLVGVDAQQEADSIVSRSLARRELLKVLGHGKQGKTVVLLDACFSGRTSDGSSIAKGLQPLVTVGGLAGLPPNTIVMTAARANQFAGPLPGAGRPAFSYLALGALRGWGGEGPVTAGSVVAYAKKVLATFSAQLVSSGQDPELSYGDSDAVLGRGREKGPDLAKLVLNAASSKSEVSFGSSFAVDAPKIAVASVGDSLANINIEAEKALDAALDAQENASVLPDARAQAWCKLSLIGGNNPYAEKARKACSDWNAYAASFLDQVRSFDKDFKTAADYLSLKRKTKEQKLSVLDAFAAAYQKAGADWPGVFQWGLGAIAQARGSLAESGQASVAGAPSETFKAMLQKAAAPPPAPVAAAPRNAAEQNQEIENAIKNPWTATIDGKTPVRGRSDARLTIVEFSDFQCPFCARGYKTVEQLRQKYGRDLRVVFKNMPLPMHAHAMPAAKFFVAATFQSQDKAWELYDRFFQDQDRLGDAYFRDVSREIGLDVERLERDIDSQEVKDVIEADGAEFKRLGFAGTPSFLINGVPLRGAYPIESFEAIIEKLPKSAMRP